MGKNFVHFSHQKKKKKITINNNKNNKGQLLSVQCSALMFKMLFASTEKQQRSERKKKLSKNIQQSVHPFEVNSKQRPEIGRERERKKDSDKTKENQVDL